MNELELLEQLQTILNKLENNEDLTDHEYKVFSSVVFSVTMGVIERSLNYILTFLGDDDE